MTIQMLHSINEKQLISIFLNLFPIFTNIYFGCLFTGRCTNVTCDFYGICKDDNQNIDGYTCECASSCDAMLKDNKFEISDKAKEMFLEYEIENEDIGIHFSKEKVCATNGLAYESECHMRTEACNQRQHLDVSNMGECGKII